MPVTSPASAGPSDFVYILHRPADADGSTLVLLHGTGGDEKDLMGLAADLAPRATLIGVRGRSAEEGVLRWFRRGGMTSFDQAHIRQEAAALTDFISALIQKEKLDPARVTWLGYSNGANLIGAMMLLHPGTIRRAVLLRGIAVLDSPPEANLAGAQLLLLSGRSDPYGRLAPALVAALRASGAGVDEIVQDAGHGLVHADLAAVRSWLQQHAA